MRLPETRKASLVTCSIDKLRPHPSLAQLQIAPSANDLAAAIRQRDHAIEGPLTITREFYILDGYSLWHLALKEGRAQLPCLQLDQTEEESLLWLLQKHQRSHGLNDFQRVRLALQLEELFRARARLNQQVGGQRKGSSNLAEAERLDVRSEIAAAAGVSTGNVSKVKLLTSVAHPELLQALRLGEVSIHRASLWIQDPERQLDCLRLHLGRRGISSTINALVNSNRLANQAKVMPLDLQRIASALVAIDPKRKASVHIAMIPVAGEVILVSRGLLRALESQEEL